MRFPKVAAALAGSALLVFTSLGLVPRTSAGQLPLGWVDGACAPENPDDPGQLIVWRGGKPRKNLKEDPASTEPHGTATVCWTLYRDASAEAGDIYRVVLDSRWAPAEAKNGFTAAFMSQSVRSNTKPEKGNVDYTPTATARQDCMPLSVGLSVGALLAISVGTTFEACGVAVTVTLSRLGIPGQALGAVWSAPTAGGLRRVETQYVQRVKHGAKPSYQIEFKIPSYVYKKTTLGQSPRWSILPTTTLRPPSFIYQRFSVQVP